MIHVLVRVIGKHVYTMINDGTRFVRYKLEIIRRYTYTYIYYNKTIISLIFFYTYIFFFSVVYTHGKNMVIE